MTSSRGEPLRAIVSIQTAPGEQVGPECLSLGDERDAPDPGLPLIRDATFALSPTGDSIEFVTSAAIAEPAVAVVLRVQCPGGPSYARLVNLRLKPAGGAKAIVVTRSVPGATLTIQPGDTLYRIARTMFPQNGQTVQNLVRAIVLVNPELFPEQRSRPLRVGEKLLIPDLRTIDRILKNPPPKPAPPPPTVAAAPAPAKTAPDAAPAPPPAPATAPAPAPAPVSAAPAKPADALQLRIATDLDLSRLGADKARRAELRRLFSGEPPQRVVTVQAPAADTAALELKATQLRETQSLIDQQIGKLEQAVTALAQAVMATPPRPAPAPPAPAPAPAPRPQPPQVIVRHEMPSWIWGAFAATALVAAGLTLLLARRSRRRMPLDEHEARIDQLLEEARAAAGPLLSPPPSLPDATERAPAPKPAAPAAPRPAPRPVVPKAAVTTQPEVPKAAPAQEPEAPPPPATGVDFVLDSGAQPADEEAEVGVSTNLRQEMEQALDNTRSMFTDVDRFIALGRGQNAISLLEFQIQKDPKDRDAWVKLMAVYRQEAMDAAFEKAHREFKRLFPGER